MPKLYSYVVSRDYGFAPNPFYQLCTLATCKPNIRKHATVNDWVVGTSSAGNNKIVHFVYAMCVSETMTYDEYWQDSRFKNKRPNLYGSKKQAYGDNIYHRDNDSTQWHQEDSHHSNSHGKINLKNLRNDTKTNRILISNEFIYWGKCGPKIRMFRGKDIQKQRQGHRYDFDPEVVNEFIKWFRGYDDKGYCGKPLDW